MDAPREVEQVGTCWECGYSLRGLITPRCPECGRPFDPADKTTMNMGIEVGWIKRWLMRPPGWPLHVLTAAAVFFSFWACVTPTATSAFVDVLSNLFERDQVGEFPWSKMFKVQTPLQRFLVAYLIWLGITAIWSIRRLARWITIKRLSKQKPANFAYWRRWLMTPVILAGTVLLCRSSLLPRAGFYLSKHSLDKAVADAKASGGWLTPRRLGVFDRYPKDDDAPQILTRYDETLVALSPRVFFVYRENGKPAASWQTSEVRRLSVNWFWVDINSDQP